MFYIEPKEFAPSWMVKTADTWRKQVYSMPPNANFYACIRIYDNASAFSNLRNRTDEIIAMLRGLNNDLECDPLYKDYTGCELQAFGFEAVGAQFIQTFRVFSI